MFPKWIIFCELNKIVGFENTRSLAGSRGKVVKAMDVLSKKATPLFNNKVTLVSLNSFVFSWEAWFPSVLTQCHETWKIDTFFRWTNVTYAQWIYVRTREEYEETV